MDCVTAGKVLVQLYLQTKPKYLLTNKKLQCLLVIAQMARLSVNDRLFDDDIRNLKYYFTLDCIADNFVYNSAIVDGKTIDDSLDYTFNDFIIPYNEKRIYNISEPIEDEDKKFLIDVFIQFGSYHEQTLFMLLNEFKPLKTVPLFSVVEKNVIKEFLVKAFDNNEFEDNPIFGFYKDVYSKYSSQQLADEIPDEINLMQPGVDEDFNVSNDVGLHHKNEKINNDIDNVENLQESVLKTDILKDYSSLNQVTMGKKYSVLIETNSVEVKDICVTAISTKEKVKGDLKKINNTLYCFSFFSVPSDIQISVKY